MSGSVLTKLFCLSLIFLNLSASDFSDISDLITQEQYEKALITIEGMPLSKITQKRLLLQLADHWNELTSKDKKKFDTVLDGLLPADRTVIEKAIERASEKLDADSASVASVLPPVEEKKAEEKIIKDTEPANKNIKPAAKPVAIHQPKVITEEKITKKITPQKQRATKKVVPASKPKRATHRKIEPQPKKKLTVEIPLQVEQKPAPAEAVLEKQIEESSIREEL